MRTSYGFGYGRMSKIIMALFSGAALVWLLLNLQQVEAAAPTSGPDDPDAPGSISGVVTDAAGNPLPGMDVLLFRAPFDGMSPGVPVPTPTPAISLKNNVQAQQFSAPLDTNPRIIKTDASGAYQFNTLGAAIYRIGFRDPTNYYAVQFFDGAPSLNSASDIPVAGDAITGINAKLSVGGIIRGMITSTQSTPVLNASIQEVGLGINTSYYYGYSFGVSALRNIDGQWNVVASTTAFAPTGTYELSALPAGVYRICTPDYFNYGQPIFQDGIEECYDNVASSIDAATDIAVDAGQTISNIDILLGDGADLSRVGGLVTGIDNQPLKDIQVSVSQWINGGWNSYVYTYTDSSGHYLTDYVRPGIYTAQFTDYFGSYFYAIYGGATTWEAAKTFTVGVSADRLDIDAQLVLGGRITGTVTILGEIAPDNGYVMLSPVDPGNAPVFYADHSWIDPVTGIYDLTGIPPGTYKVSAATFPDQGFGNLGGFSGTYGGSNPEDAIPLTVQTGDVYTDINIVLGEGAFESAIEGTVSVDGIPKPGVQVSLYYPEYYANPYVVPKAQYYTFTNQDGEYRIDGLLSNRYYLGFSDPDGVYASTFYDKSATLYNATPVDIFGAETVTGFNISLMAGGSIGGHIFSTFDGLSIGDATVVLYTGAQYYGWRPVQIVHPNSAGDYVITGLMAGIYRVCISESTDISGGRCFGAPISPYGQAPLESALDIVLPAAGEVKGINLTIGPIASRRTFLPIVTN